MSAVDLGQAVLDRLEEKQRALHRLQAELEEAQAALRHAQEAYSDLAALLGERLQVHVLDDLPRCARVVRVELTVAEPFALLRAGERQRITEHVAETLSQGLRLQLAAAGTTDWKRSAFVLERLRYLPVPERVEE